MGLYIHLVSLMASSSTSEKDCRSICPSEVSQTYIRKGKRVETADLVTCVSNINESNQVAHGFKRAKRDRRSVCVSGTEHYLRREGRGDRRGVCVSGSNHFLRREGKWDRRRTCVSRDPFFLGQTEVKGNKGPQTCSQATSRIRRTMY